MPCKICNKPFEPGEMRYENGGISPLCYPCAEKGQLTAVSILGLIFIIFLSILLGVSYLRGEYDSIDVKIARMKGQI